MDRRFKARRVFVGLSNFAAYFFVRHGAIKSNFSYRSQISFVRVFNLSNDDDKTTLVIVLHD